MNFNYLSKAPRLVLIKISKLLNVNDIFVLCSLSQQFAMKFGGVVPSRKKNMFYFTNQSIGLHEVWTFMLLRDYGVSYVANKCPINSRAARQLIADSMKRFCDFETKKGLQHNYEKACKMRLLYNRLRRHIDNQFAHKAAQSFFQFTSFSVPACSIYVWMGCVFFIAETTCENTMFVISLVDYLTRDVIDMQSLKQIGLFSKPEKIGPNRNYSFCTSGSILSFQLRTDDKYIIFILNDENVMTAKLDHRLENAYVFFDNASLYAGVDKQVFVCNDIGAQDTMSLKFIVGEKTNLNILSGFSLGRFGVVATCKLATCDQNILVRFAFNDERTIEMIENTVLESLFQFESLRLYLGHYDRHCDTHYVCGLSKVDKKNNSLWFPRVLVWRLCRNRSLEAYVLDLTNFILSRNTRVYQARVKLKTNYMMIEVPRNGPIILDILSGHYRCGTDSYGWKTENSCSTNFCEFNNRFYKDFYALRTNVPVLTRKE